MCKNISLTATKGPKEKTRRGKKGGGSEGVRIDKRTTTFMVQSFWKRNEKKARRGGRKRTSKYCQPVRPPTATKRHRPVERGKKREKRRVSILGIFDLKIHVQTARRKTIHVSEKSTRGTPIETERGPVRHCRGDGNREGTASFQRPSRNSGPESGC